MLEELVALLSGHSLVAAHALVLFVLVLCGLGLPMPEDIVLVTGGVLAWLASPVEPLTFAAMITHPATLTMVGTGLLGILVGDSIIFFAGRRIGGHVADSRLLRRLVTPAKVRKVEAMMRRRGSVVVMLARFLPGLRAPTYFTVGHSRFPYWRFLLYDGLAALVSAPLWVLLGYWFGDDIRKAAETASRFSHIVLAAAVALVIVALVLRWRRNRRNS
ncbi:MAG TPA: DedA family protein [Myxococcota bacterium]|jgi:membrane protein DedA with SNARE-associated domain|nr:DedA family protein [Myxococcota bacterium]